MAIPITFTPDKYDPYEAFRARLDGAPREHAEAMLAAYDLVQALHERGVLDLARSALAAGDEIVDTVVDQMDTPETIRAIRNLLFLGSVLGRVDPEWIQGLTRVVPDALAETTTNRESVGLWRILRRLCSRDALYGLAATVELLASFGRQLHALKTSRVP